MTENDEMISEVWKKFIMTHMKVILVMISVVIGAVAIGIFTFLRVVADAQAALLVPAVLGEWTIGHVIGFMLNVILWELVFVSWVIPVGLIFYFGWYKNLPEEERAEHKMESRRGKTVEEGGGFSFFVGVIWLIIMWIDGRWDLAFQSWTFNDWVYSWLAAGLWVLGIIGVAGGTAFLIWWMRNRTQQES
jgi:hypothetical protein